MQRDHMMGFVQSLDDGPAEPYPLGLPVGGTPAQNAREKRWLAEMAEVDRIAKFETGDHMLPGMRKKDFPKEYDTRVAIKDRADDAYNRALRDMVVYGTGVVGFDAGAPEGDRTVVFSANRQYGKSTIAAELAERLIDEWAGMPKNWYPKSEEINRKIMAAYRPFSVRQGIKNLDW